MTRTITQSRLTMLEAAFEIAVFLFGLIFVAANILGFNFVGSFQVFIFSLYLGLVLSYLILRYRVIDPLFPSFENDLSRSLVWLTLSLPFVLGLEYLFFGPQLEDRLTIASIYIFLLLLITLAKTAFHVFKLFFFKGNHGCVKIILVGVSRQFEKVARIFNHPEAGTQIIGIFDNVAKKGELIDGVPVLGKINAIESYLNSNVVDLIIQLSGIENTTTLMTLAEHRRIRFMVAPQMFGLISRNVSSVPIENEMFLEPRGTVLSGWAQVFKRIIDFVLGLVLLVLLSPIFLIIMLLIKLTDLSAPIFINQIRLDGRSGKEFKMYRFRTLPKEIKEPQPTAANFRSFPETLTKNIYHPKARGLGLFLRRTHLMDLPQIWNAVKGNMGLVGPRPPFPVEYENYDWFDRKRLLIKPGITGAWQLKRSKFTFDEMVDLDRAYVENWSFWLDARLFLLTILKFITGSI